MFSLFVVIKLGVLIYLIKYLLDTGDIKKTSLYFAISYMALSIIFGIGIWSLLFFVSLLILFALDFVTGYAYFWLIDRYQSNYLMFYIVIIFGIILNFSTKFFLSTL